MNFRNFWNKIKGLNWSATDSRKAQSEILVEGLGEVRRVESAIRWIVAGVFRGISRHSGQTDIALLLGNRKTNELRIYDESGILTRQADPLRIRLQNWQTSNIAPTIDFELFEYSDDSRPHPVTELPDIFQMWFLTPVPEGSNVEVWRSWLYFASRRIELTLQTGNVWASEPYSREMEHFSRYAVADCIIRLRRDDLGSFAELDIDEIISNIFQIALITEEGKRPRGNIAFSEPGFANTDGQAEPRNIVGLANAIPLHHHKHVGKMLRAVSRGGCLLANDRGVWGISTDETFPNALLASFNSGMVSLSYEGQEISRIVRGQFIRPSPADPASQLRNFFPTEVSNQCVNSLAQIVSNAWEEHFGCTLLICRPELSTDLSAQFLTESISVNNMVDQLRTVSGMAAVDGALCFDLNGNLRAFGCILHSDRLRRSHEDPSRGARFNSAARFAEHNPDVFIIVVSEDGPMNVFGRGEILQDPLALAADLRAPQFPGTTSRGWLTSQTFDEWLSSNS